jgi:hypothetical protein
LKKLEDATAERNSARTKEARRKFADWLMKAAVQRPELVFIDEAGINLYCTRMRGRAPIGQRAIRVVNGQRGRNLTVCFAVSNTRGLLLHRMLEGGMTAVLFRDFLAELAPLCEENSAFICDNAPAHRGAG